MPRIVGTPTSEAVGGQKDTDSYVLASTRNIFNGRTLSKNFVRF